jgi:membrane-associated phospholipid phosphatase
MNYRLYVYTNLFVSIIIGFSAIFLGFDTLTIGIHHLNHRILDIFFKNYTIWAEWPVIVIGILLLTLKNWRMSVWFSLVFGIEALTVQGIKVILNLPRPIEKFGAEIRNIDGEVLKHFQAFPSGHTSAAFFATGMILLAIPENSKKHLFLFIGIFSAFMVAYSRIYLGQHSVEDIISGCVISNAFYYFAGYSYPWFNQKLKSNHQHA